MHRQEEFLVDILLSDEDGDDATAVIGRKFPVNWSSKFGLQTMRKLALKDDVGQFERNNNWAKNDSFCNQIEETGGNVCVRNEDPAFRKISID